MTQQIPPPSPTTPRSPSGYGDPPRPGYEVPAQRSSGSGPPQHPGPDTAPGPGATNTMAVLALVFAFVFSPLGVVFGILGRRQIRQTGEGGRGMATAGIWIGGISVALGIAAAVLAVVLATTVTPTTPSLSVSSADVEAQITTQFGLPASEVSCADTLPAVVGASIVCDAPVNGSPGEVRSTVTSVEGTQVQFNLTPMG